METVRELKLAALIPMELDWKPSLVEMLGLMMDVVTNLDSYLVEMTELQKLKVYVMT